MITAHTDTVKVSRSDSGWPSPVSHVHYLWAVLIARIYEILPLIFPVCGSELRLIAAVTLANRRRPSHRPVRVPHRDARDEFDQTVSW